MTKIRKFDKTSIALAESPVDKWLICNLIMEKYKAEVEDEDIVNSGTCQTEESHAQIYGPNNDKVVSTITRVSKIEWFSNAGTTKYYLECEKAIKQSLTNLCLEDYSIEWVHMSDLEEILISLENSQILFWKVIEEIRMYLKTTAHAVKRESILSNAAEGISELVFNECFSRGLKSFEQYDKRINRIASGAVLYVVSTGCAWDTLGDLPGGWKVNPFDSLIEIFELGHWPLGVVDNKFYIL